MYDVNRNMVFHGRDIITTSVNVNTIKEGICYLPTNKSKALKALAITALLLIAIVFIIILLISIFLCSKMPNMLDMWKFLLHNWMRLQLIAFLLFIGIYQPCCVREFLNIIYRYAVSWNQGFRGVIWNTLDENPTILNGMKKSVLPEIFREHSILAFILFNITIWFIV